MNLRHLLQPNPPATHLQTPATTQNQKKEPVTTTTALTTKSTPITHHHMDVQIHAVTHHVQIHPETHPPENTHSVADAITTRPTCRCRIQTAGRNLTTIVGVATFTTTAKNNLTKIQNKKQNRNRNTQLLKQKNSRR
jgi:hypothetical protein